MDRFTNGELDALIDAVLNTAKPWPKDNDYLVTALAKLRAQRKAQA